jgi:dipeptidyl aminopeptidase/acylaminoacyl peptidase
MAAIAVPLYPAAKPSPDDPNTATRRKLLAEPSLRDAALSPKGRRAAITGVHGRDAERMAFVLCYDCEKPDIPSANIPIGDCEIERVAWITDNRLLVWVLLDKDKKGQTTGYYWKGEVLRVYTRRVIAMDHDGQNQVILFGNQKTALGRRRNLGSVVDFTSDDGRTILMQAWDGQYDCQALYRVDIFTGEAVQLERGAPATDAWLTQKGVPVVRLDSTGSTVSVQVRAPGQTDWTFYRKFRRDESAKLDGIAFLGSTAEPGVLVVATTMDGDDRQSIQTFDIRDLKFKARLAGRADRDMTGYIADRARDLVATSWIDDRVNYQFADPDLARHYRGLGGYFKNDCNIVLQGISQERDRLLVYVSGPRHAGSYWLYDRRKTKLQPLGATHVGLTQTPLAGMEAIKLTSRDGQPLTAYLTRPNMDAIGKRPIVVLPHGGPETRDAYDFDPFVQALALEGWMVLQINFRGSAGYGRAFADAGRRRWGDLMQNDVEDALKVVLDRGEADPDRIAICGISYGGYAALMGAIKTPDRYKAVVSIAGVSDLLKVLNSVRLRDGSDSLTYEYWRRTIGDPSRDQKALAFASPALRAKELKAPVLLMHGEIDSIVSVDQSRTMHRALKAAGRPVEYVEVAMEGHPNWNEDRHLMMVERSIAHIRKAFV